SCAGAKNLFWISRGNRQADSSPPTHNDILQSKPQNGVRRSLQRSPSVIETLNALSKGFTAAIASGLAFVAPVAAGAPTVVAAAGLLVAAVAGPVFVAAAGLAGRAAAPA